MSAFEDQRDEFRVVNVEAAACHGAEYPKNKFVPG